MLMTRFLYVTSSVLIFLLNGIALWQVLSDDRPASSIVTAALIVTALIWPLSLAMTYRIGQATGRLQFIRARQKRRASAK